MAPVLALPSEHVMPSMPGKAISSRKNGERFPPPSPGARGYKRTPSRTPQGEPEAIDDWRGAASDLPTYLVPEEQKGAHRGVAKDSALSPAFHPTGSRNMLRYAPSPKTRITTASTQRSHSRRHGAQPGGESEHTHSNNNLSVPPGAPKFHEDDISTWNENMFRLGSGQSRGRRHIERMPLPQELLDHMAAAMDPRGGTKPPPLAIEASEDRPSSKGFIRSDGAFSDGYSWSRGGGLDPEAMPPTLSHCWWEDTIFPKLFPRNKPGGVEWKVLKSSLQRSLQEATKNSDNAEELLDHVFRTAFHEIYRRLPLFRGAVIHSEKEFKHLQEELSRINDEKDAEAQKLRDELTEIHTALQVWRIRALRAETRAEQSKDQVAEFQQEVAVFKAGVGSQFEKEKLEHTRLKQEHKALQCAVETMKLEHERRLSFATEKITNDLTVMHNDVLIKQLAEFAEKENVLRAKIAASDSSCGEKLLENGKQSTRIRNMDKHMERLEKILNENYLHFPERPKDIQGPS
eukprot:CAMPEP_0114242318 /NCGR_PEP_ID=MMETSP0058-20121206/10103_1 /TAXON_ID=36894 /ORGANISM="Pyramimonas parkeae, CCMP726" /LENGTH=516 /DNA_ID=CAMNT_0001354905 /DNA_START=81 /DNA_END=1632 /DNA_ORIENTATION=-